MIVLAAIISALIVIFSTALYTGLLWWADRYEKEPWRLLAMALFWGAIPAALLALWGEIHLHLPEKTLLQNIVAAGMVGPIIEEVAKGLMILFLFISDFMEFDGVLDGLIYGALVGFGFAMSENFLYLISAAREGLLAWSTVLLLRQVVFGLNHAFFTAFTGIGFGLARDARGARRALLPLLGLALAVFFHGLHNTTLSLATVNGLAFLFTLLFDAGGILIVGIVLVLAILRERRIMTVELADEVGQTLSAEDYERVRRIQPPLIGLAGEERRRLQQIRQLAAELALKKHQQRVQGETRDLRQRIFQLRAALIALRHDMEHPMEEEE